MKISTRRKDVEKMKISSKGRYVRNRVMSGYSPHRMLKMAQEKALAEPTQE
ncbi:MAG: hypothetical protein ACXAEN_14465 [Candidatus Thorarchaeota archaeon]|jgi:hypothetical protein